MYLMNIVSHEFSTTNLNETHDTASLLEVKDLKLVTYSK